MTRSGSRHLSILKSCLSPGLFLWGISELSENNQQYSCFSGWRMLLCAFAVHVVQMSLFSLGCSVSGIIREQRIRNCVVSATWTRGQQQFDCSKCGLTDTASAATKSSVSSHQVVAQAVDRVYHVHIIVRNMPTSRIFSSSFLRGLAS